jgi:hypothetical protein
MERDKDRFKYQSAQFAYIAFDQVEHFTELQYTYLHSRLRTLARDPATGKGVPTRIVAAANPPDDEQPGAIWLMARWAPWLDDMYPQKANDGEIRWFIRVEGKEVEVPAGTPKATSRTFIRAFIHDNKILLEADPEYLNRLENLPEPYRSMYLKGDWMAGKSDERRVIPLSWVKQAQKRWTPQGRNEQELTCTSCDVGRGRDISVLSNRYGNWFDRLVEVQSRNTAVVGAKLKGMKDDRAVGVVDVIGVGAGIYDFLRTGGGEDSEEFPPVPRMLAFNGSEKSTRVDSTGLLTFRNKRAEAWWSAREALDPESGLDIALPPDPELLAELCTPTWQMLVTGIKVQDKDEIKKTLGRSPNKADSVVMALWVGSWKPPGMVKGEVEEMAKRRRRSRRSAWHE